MVAVHVNVPYPMLLQRIELATQRRIHPEIYFSSQDLDGFLEREARELAQALLKTELETTVHGPFMDLSPGGVDRRIKQVTLERLSKTIELGAIFRAKTIVFHPGYEKWKFDENVSLWLESSLETWAPLTQEAERQGLVLALENVFEESPESLESLLSAIDSPHLRFCFDTGHHNVFSKVPARNWIEALGDYLCEVHLHDNHRERDEHLPIGEGTFAFDDFFALLSERQLEPILTLEPHEEAHLWRGLEALRRYIRMDRTSILQDASPKRQNL